MFCRNCGAQNKDDATFCQSCGAPLSSAGGESASMARPAKRPNIILIGGIAVIVVVVVALFMLMGGRSEKDVVKKLVNGFSKGDAKAIVSLIPEKVVDELCDDQDMTKKELINDLDDELDDMLDTANDRYDKWSISYKILDTDKLEGKKLRNIKNDYEDIDVKVKEAKILSVKLTLKADGDTENTTVDIPVIKVGKSWYLDFSNFNMYSMFY